MGGNKFFGVTSNWEFGSNKFLGVAIYDHLRWKMHMEYILKQIRITFGRVRKVSSLLSKKSINGAIQLSDKKLSHILHFLLVFRIYNHDS